VVHIRPASTADAEAVALVRRESWLVAYSGLIKAEIIDRATRPYDGTRQRAAFASRPWQRMLVAEAQRPARGGRPAREGRPGGPGAAVAPVTEVVGYASYGPERDQDGATGLHPGDSVAPHSCVAELYALYVAPAWWSTGTGRALMDRVLSEVRAQGYPRIVLWVLEQNARARRFYERAGFRLSGASQVLHGLGGVTEICYEQALGPP
jgi:GNAT superfamily N-acetyltransferase